jgi:hypothetical protein
MLQMNRVFPIIFVLVSVLLVSCAESVIEIDAEELCEQYREDPETADANYKDRTLIVTGTVTLTDTTNMGARYAMMDCMYSPTLVPAEEGWLLLPRRTEYGIECRFDEENHIDWLRLVEGQTVTIKGGCGGYSLDLFGKGEPANIVLRHCSLSN